MIAKQDVQQIELVEQDSNQQEPDLESQLSASTKTSEMKPISQNTNIKRNYEEFEDVVLENNLQDNDIKTEQNPDELLQDNSLMEGARRNFIRKVFFIIFFQLLLTSVLCAASMYIREFLDFQLDQYGWLFISLGLIVFTQIYVCASRTAARRVPLNYILLAGFTIGWGYLISFFCSGYSVNPDGTSNERGQTIIFLSVIVTFAVVLSLCFVAFTTNTNFTIGGTSCSIFGSCLAIISTLILIGFPFIYIAYSMVSGVTFGFYLVFDLQTIMDGKYTDITLDDYILASMLVYTDIVMLFIRIVEIISRILPRD